MLKTKVSLKKVHAEMLTVRFKLPSGNILCLSTFYRVGYLGQENFDAMRDYLVTLASKKR